MGILNELRDNPGALGTREIARAFGLGPADQPALREMLRKVERSGELVRTGSRIALTASGRLLLDYILAEISAKRPTSAAAAETPVSAAA